MNVWELHLIGSLWFIECDLRSCRKSQLPLKISNCFLKLLFLSCSNVLQINDSLLLVLSRISWTEGTARKAFNRKPDTREGKRTRRDSAS